MSLLDEKQSAASIRDLLDHPIVHNLRAVLRSAAQNNDRLEDRMPLRLLRAANMGFARIYHQLEVKAPCTVPRFGPAIIVCNHISGLDPALIQSVCPRLIVWMMAKEFYDLRGMLWLYKAVEAIPVQRSGKDLTATRRAMRVLHEGRVLGIFPEGRIADNRELLPFQTGVAMMALKTGVKIYPAGLEGTQRNKPMIRACLYPQRARIAFGKPIEPMRDGKKMNLDQATTKIRNAVEAMRQAL